MVDDVDLFLLGINWGFVWLFVTYAFTLLWFGLVLVGLRWFFPNWRKGFFTTVFVMACVILALTSYVVDEYIGHLPTY